MGNGFATRDTEDLIVLARVMAERIGDPARLGLSVELVGSLAAASERLFACSKAQQTAFLRARNATEAKANAREELLAVLSNVAAVATAHAPTSDEALVGIGLAPRRAGASPRRALHTPTRLTVTPFANGTARLEWERGPNRRGAIYRIEARGENGDWRIVGTTTRLRHVVANATPGVTNFYRVTATNSTDASVPSDPQAIYPGAAARKAA